MNFFSRLFESKAAKEDRLKRDERVEKRIQQIQQDIAKEKEDPLREPRRKAERQRIIYSVLEGKLAQQDSLKVLAIAARILDVSLASDGAAENEAYALQRKKRLQLYELVARGNGIKDDDWRDMFENPIGQSAHYWKSEMWLDDDECKIVETADSIVSKLLKGEKIEKLPMLTQKAAKTLDTSYVESIFDFNLKEKTESRNWQRIVELKELCNLIDEKQLAQAEEKLKYATRKFPTFDVVYCWQGNVFKMNGEIEKARQAYTEGLEYSDMKCSLCERLAKLEFEHGTLKEAVRWWIRSILLQMANKSINEADSFCFLAFVALLNQQNDAASKLRGALRGRIDLSHEAKEKVSRKVNAEPYDEINSAIEELIKSHWTDF